MNPTPAFPSLTSLADHLWQSTVVALVILAMLAIFRRLSPRCRLALGWIALAKFLIPSAALSALATTLAGLPRSWLESDVLTVPIPAAVLADSFVQPVASTAIPARPVESLGLVLIDWTLVLWLAIALGLVVATSLRHWLLQLRIGSTGLPIDGMAQRVRAIAERHAHRPPSRVVVTPDLGPALLGVRRPTLVLPAPLVESLSEKEFETVVLHELVHLQRRDNLLSLLRRLIVSFCWFHPLAWLLDRHLSRETELACDARVVDLTRNPTGYANGILKSLRFSLGGSRPGAAGITSPPVVERVRAILGPNRTPELRELRLAVIGFGLTLVVLAGHFGSVEMAAARQTPAAVALDPARITTAPATPVPVATLLNPVDPAPAAVEPIAPVASVPEAPPAVPVAQVDEEPLPDFIPVVLSTPASPPPQITLTPAPAPAVVQPATLPASQTGTGTAAPVAPILQAQELPPAIPATTRPMVRAEPVPAANPERRSERRIYLPNEVEQVPVAFFKPSASYPSRLSSDFSEVYVRFVVNERGRVENPMIRQSGGTLFDESALRAIAQWRFEPGRLEERAVPTLMEARINFSPPNPRNALQPLFPGKQAAGPAVAGETRRNPNIVRTAASTGSPGSTPPAREYLLVQSSPGNPAAAPTPAVAAAATPNSSATIPPSAVVSVIPAWTRAMLPENGSATVVVRFIVSAAGRVTNPTIRQTGGPTLNKLALETVTQWQFIPGQKDGRSVAAVHEVEFRFRPAGVAATASMQSPDDPTARRDIMGINTAEAPGQKDSPPDGLIFDIKDLDRQPQPTVTPPPVFPASQRRAAIQAHVVVAIVVDAQGRVANPEVRQSGGVEFDKAVLDAIVRWRFRPGVKAGQNVASRMDIPFNFSLK